jgi:hypothetical protein
MMGRRQHWNFRFMAKRLCEAAAEREGYHREHLAEWEHRLAEITPEVTGSVAIKQYPVTGGNRLALEIAPHLQERYSECQAKIAEHTHRAEEYARFARAFRLAPPEMVYDLDADDVAFFNL